MCYRFSIIYSIKLPSNEFNETGLIFRVSIFQVVHLFWLVSLPLAKEDKGLSKNYREAVCKRHDAFREPSTLPDLRPRNHFYTWRRQPYKVEYKPQRKEIPRTHDQYKLRSDVVPDYKRKVEKIP
jgi:hypothetical protein